MDVRITKEGITLPTKVYSSNSKTMMLNVEIVEAVRNRTKRWKVKSRQALHVVIMNMLSCVSKKQRLYYQRQNNKRTDDMYSRNLNNRDICLAIDYMVEAGLLFNYIAERQYQKNDEDKTSSWISPTDLFKDMFCLSQDVMDNAELAYISAHISVELRNKDKVRIDYEDDESIKEAERVVFAINCLNAKHVFTDYLGDPMVNMYSRIFNEVFTKGGRWFRAAILRIKNKESNNRLKTLIDGESVVEIDLDCLHISMLSDILGITKYLNKDIYYHVLDKQDYSTFNRRLVKLGINIMLNATSEYKAKNAIDDLIKSEKKGFYCYATGQDVINAIYEALPEFRNKFCNKECTGLMLQNKDSWIAHYVIDEFLKINCPILVVHDSFIVQKKNSDKLIDAMSLAYKRVMQVERTVAMKISWLEGETLHKVDCSK